MIPLGPVEGFNMPRSSFGGRGWDVLPKMTIVMKMMKKMVINTAKILIYYDDEDACCIASAVLKVNFFST